VIFRVGTAISMTYRLRSSAAIAREFTQWHAQFRSFYVRSTPWEARAGPSARNTSPKLLRQRPAEIPEFDEFPPESAFIDLPGVF